MRIIDITHPPQSLWIGREGENTFRPVSFECANWFSAYPNATIVAYYQPYGSSDPYPLVLVEDGTKRIWHPLLNELVKGDGELQIVLMQGETVGTSAIIPTKVERSLISNADHPASEAPSWAVEVVQDVEEAASHYPKIVNDYWWVWDVQTDTWVNTGVKARGEGGGGNPNAVLYTPQTLTPAQKAQARGNVGAISADDLAYVTPEQFGAVGDGVTDDTDALQAAVRAGNVACEAGKTYLISKPIIVAEHIYDFGGCTIKLADNYEKNAVEIDGVPYGYCGLVFDNLDNFCVRNLTLDCNKAGNASTAITGAIFSDSVGTFENCTFQNATYKHLVINRGNDLHFYDTTLKNLGTAANCSDVYVSGTPESDVVFNGVNAVRESGNTSTGQVFYINTGNVAVSDADIENCNIFTDSRSGNTTVRDAVVYNAKNLAFIDQDSSRANPANITYENVRFYELERTSGGYGMQVGGVGSLTIDNMYVQFASASTFSHAVYFQSSYGKLNHNIRINGLRMDLGSVALQNALYFSGEDTTENVLLTDCHFKLDTMTRAYIARIANNPNNVRIENCTFDNFQFQWVYGNTNQHLLGVSNATPRRAATADLPTLTTADTGSIIYDTTLGIFKFWDGSAWIDPRPNVPTMATDSDMSDWTSGKTVDAAVLKTDFQSVGQSLGSLDNAVTSLQARKADKTDIPTAVSDLTNDSGFQTAAQVQSAIAAAAELPSGGTTGDFLRMTASGAAWETVQTWQGGSY